MEASSLATASTASASGMRRGWVSVSLTDSRRRMGAEIRLALKVPNAATRAAMEEARGMSRARFQTAEALFDGLAKEGG